MTCDACGSTLQAKYCGECGAPAAKAVQPPTSAIPAAVNVTPGPFRGLSGHEPTPLIWVADGAPATHSGFEQIPWLRSAVDRLGPRWVLVLVGTCALTVAILIFAVTKLGVAASPKHTLTGSLTVHSAAAEGCGMAYATATRRMDRLRAVIRGEIFPCPEGPGIGYSDLTDGTVVSIKDQTGTLLGSGVLSNGTLGAGVTFDFTVADVPEAEFYQVEIADRGELPYSLQQLEDAYWTVAASID